MESFPTWLNNELEKRGWTQSEAARRGEVSQSMFAKVISGHANPGPDFLIGVSRAFGLTRREVFSRAGIIEPDSPNTSMVKEMQTLFAALSEDDQRAILKQVKALYASYKSYPGSQDSTASP
jgi:transcriptional regulator with XRE-family HTH domain